MTGGLEGKRILLGVTGGIAAYKSVYLLRLLRNEGAAVKVVMTEAAREFVTPLTFETLSENKVHTRLFGAEGEPGDESPVEHVDLAKWPDLVIVAPTTANTIAKCAGGAADDLLSTVISAYEGPVVLAPAMNDAMWRNKATQDNLRQLGARGFRVVPPESGDLACGYEAEGRMAEPEKIIEHVKTVCSSDFSKLRVLVSVGGTEEDLDPVRVITNRSSGRMGFALAEAARNRGARVTVVMGRVFVRPPIGVRLIETRTSAEMSEALKKEFVESDVLIMAAAVSDYSVASPSAQKIKGDTWTVELTRTEDILESLGKMKGKRFIIGFALETENIKANTEKKLAKKKCDLIVVNNPLEKGAAFEHETNAVTIYNAEGEVLSTGLKSKHEIADIILQTARTEKAFQKILVEAR
ncbi:MAG: bifunctional phosphopantothenoylcysteine decarboxylase/phosphopantothenate--cysteine ligase CoaBC [Candidatus Latescibacterota bacterium]|nr:MAG: bifunctional phosphopantothenoylcysteine decarboxylase/phosphopantothenate--cysteine ligase CoaBC [Candidatus Latescibacterota bacterium]